jgi:hypothetical protein
MSTAGKLCIFVLAREMDGLLPGGIGNKGFAAVYGLAT